MLSKFFSVLIIAVIVLIAIIIIKIALPMWRFMVRADAVIQLYDIFKKTFLQNDFSEKLIQVSYGDYKIEFTNTHEASVEFEKLVNDALHYYEQLGWIAIADSSLNAQKTELINICSEVRTLRWQKEGYYS